MPRSRSSAPGVSFFAFQDIITAVVGIFILITLIMILELIEKIDAKSRSTAGDVAAIVRVIEQTRIAADAIQSELSKSTALANRQSDALAVADEINAEMLDKQIETQNKRSLELQRQVASIQRQVDDSQRRQEAARHENERQRQQDEARIQEATEEADRLLGRAGKLRDTTFPMYNGTLGDGRGLVVIRLGPHPEYDGIDQSHVQISMRDGDARRRWIYNDVDDLLQDLNKRDHTRYHYVVLIAPGGAADFHDLQEYMDARQSRIRYGFDVIGRDDGMRLIFELEDQ
ncbi:hypothetical protein NHH03_06550 [Stieleria sp. TO1_6]|uniref:hypothetical protein n=1 Tax=Stieleria tagensis TaxID=2956795 RepID=UPI00209A9FAC|nr:hypothetical protein [Stieleria tagensis]MCO8121391.1 hypothetical protein [Stieleria tagensis]